MRMRTLRSDQRRALRAQAHHLRPSASIGRHGLSERVLHEIDVALRAHELIKVRAASEDRAEREAWLGRICETLDAAAVQHLGKLLVVWRPRPESTPTPAPSPAPARRSATASAKARRTQTPRRPADERRPQGEHPSSTARGTAREHALANERRRRRR